MSQKKIEKYVMAMLDELLYGNVFNFFLVVDIKDWNVDEG